MANPSQQLPELEVRTQSHARRGAEEPFPGAAMVLFPMGMELPEPEGPVLPPAVEGDDEPTDPRAEGACRFELSADEWRFVRNAPLASFLIVAGADGVVLPRERRALVNALEEGQCSPNPLFRTVCSELYRQRDRLTEIFVTDTFERDQLAEAFILVSGKLGLSEAEQFRACLLKLGRQVARSSGGLLASWGWLRGVEQQALRELGRLFGKRLS